MDITEAIFARRTIKDFKPDPVPAPLIERFLTAGLWAQNHKLTEPWRFILLGAGTRSRLAEAFGEKILSKPCVVAVCQRLEGPPAQQREDYAAIACAIQNIQLAAWAEGIGMQWSSGKMIVFAGTYELLSVDPAQDEIIALLFFGYPARVPAAQPRKALAEVLTILP